MKYLLASVIFCLVSICSYGQVNPKSTNVDGYQKKNGTYIEPHKRTVPNSTKKDNYSTKGNTNPWTGKKGAKSVIFNEDMSYRHLWIQRQ